MRVRVVNPSNPLIMPNRRARRAGGTAIVVVRGSSKPRTHRRRRRNAVLMPNMPFANAPLIVPNRRRRRRRNMFSNPFGGGTLGGMMTTFLGGGISYMGDHFIINNLGRDSTQAVDPSTGVRPSTANGMLIRNITRTVGAGLAAWAFPGALGHSMAGALTFPVFDSLFDYMSSSNQQSTSSSAPTSADAYLDDVLDGLRTRF